MRVNKPVEVFAVADPTDVYTFTDWVDCDSAPFVDFWIYVGGTPGTSWQMKVQEALLVVGGTSVDLDGETALDPIDVPINGPDRVLGNGTLRATEIDLLDQDGTVLSTAIKYRYESFGARYVRLGLKRTGAGVLPTLRVLASKGS